MGCAGCFHPPLGYPDPGSTALQGEAALRAKKTGSIEDLAVAGIDIGKDSFHLVGFDRFGQLVLRKQIKRLALHPIFDQLPRCIVGMEACLPAELRREHGKCPVLDPGSAGEQARISGEIIVGPHVEQERCAWGPDDASKLVG